MTWVSIKILKWLIAHLLSQWDKGIVRPVTDQLEKQQEQQKEEEDSGAKRKSAESYRIKEDLFPGTAM